MKKFLSLALALIMVLSLVACGDTASDNTDNSNTDANTEQTGEIKGLTAEERAKEFITVGTGPTSGIYFPIGGAFATALKEYGYQTSAEATNATGQNIQNILNGDAEIAIAMQDAVMQAYTGTGAYEGKGEAFGPTMSSSSPFPAPVSSPLRTCAANAWASARRTPAWRSTPA